VPHCSLRADGFNGINLDLQHRDVSMIAVSHAPYNKLAAYKKRMGWTFKWVSSANTDFNFDYHVSFTPEEIAKKKAFFNYAMQDPGPPEREGHSVFFRNKGGEVFHTYSCYARGNDMLNVHYHYLDMVPKGRQGTNVYHPADAKHIGQSDWNSVPLCSRPLTRRCMAGDARPHRTALPRRREDTVAQDIQARALCLN
jgi:predicted dithiol-disulfide oxidoreductase (DUF899 family)